jgi:tRNA nucleotidyltransferase/poly(A) polymerase
VQRVSETRRYEPPHTFLEVAERLESAGHQAWAVGGALRDAELGVQRAEWDLATDARPERVRELFRRTVPLGMEHGTVGVLAADGTMFEVTTFRLDVETDGRHAVVRFSDTVEEDLARRDFTINAMAWRPATDDVRDPYHGLDDLKDGVLRAVGDPASRFAEDLLRVLRGLRFAGTYRLSIEHATWKAMQAATPRLGRLSAERVREEMMKVLSADEPSEALRLYAGCGAFSIWFPELDRASLDPRWEQGLASVDAIGRHRRFLRLVRLLVLATEYPEEEGGATARGLLERLKFSNAEIRRGANLVAAYVPLVHPADAASRIREWLSEVGLENVRDLFRLHFAYARAAGSTESSRALVYTWRRVHEEIIAGPPISLGDLAVDGSDLLSLGLPEGPLVGLMLEELLAQVIESPEANTRDELMARAREIIELGGLDRLKEDARP